MLPALLLARRRLSRTANVGRPLPLPGPLLGLLRVLLLLQLLTGALWQWRVRSRRTRQHRAARRLTGRKRLTRA